MNMQQRSKDRPWIFQPFYVVAGFTQNAYATFSYGVRTTTRTYLDLINIKKENESLKNDLIKLQAQLGDMTELKLENERFSHLLEFQKRSQSKLRAARIIGRDLLPDYRSITIDKGADDGVKKGQAIVTTNGVVGYVLNVEQNTSHILLLTDRYAVIDSLVQRSRVRGILHGQSSDRCLLKYIKRDDDVKPGDIIISSGIDRIFPKGFPIGKVLSVKNDDYGLGQEVEVQPISNPSHLEEIFVIINAADYETQFDTEAPVKPESAAANTAVPASTTTEVKN